LDCDSDGHVTSEEIYKGVENMHLDYDLTSTMINDFVLKGMEITTASLDKTDFVFCTLVAMYERVIDSH